MDKEAEKQRITLEIQQFQQALQQAQNQQAAIAREIIKRQGQLEFIDSLPDEKPEGAT